MEEVPAGSDVFDFQGTLQKMHTELLALASETMDKKEKATLYGKLLDVMKTAKACMETHYSVAEIKRFMDEVLVVLDRLEPGARAQVLDALKAKRSG